MSDPETENLHPLIGYQTSVDWMGERVLSLADLWPREPRAMVVGLNPAPPSVLAGHCYQGQAGQRQLRRLSDAGLFPPPAAGSYFEEGALAAGIGFTDLVRRPTVGERGVGRAEMQHGRDSLARELSRRGVTTIICVFRHPAEALLGSSAQPGWQNQLTKWGARVFRMPGPFEAAPRVAEVMRSLAF